MVEFYYYLDAWKYATQHRVSMKLVKKVKKFNEKLSCFQQVYQLRLR